MNRLLDALAQRRGLLAVVISVVSVIALLGLARVRFDDGYRSIFRSDEPEYLLLDEFSRQFGSNDNDLLAVLDSPDLLRFADLEAIRGIHYSLLEVKGVQSVYSIFSLPRLAELLQDGEPANDELAVQRAEILEETLIQDKLISRDGRTSLLLAYVGDPALPVAELKPLLGEVQEVISREAQGSEVRARLTVIPAMRLEIVSGVQRDQVKFNVVGLACALTSVTTAVGFGSLGLRKQRVDSALWIGLRRRDADQLQRSGYDRSIARFDATWRPCSQRC